MWKRIYIQPLLASHDGSWENEVSWRWPRVSVRRASTHYSFISRQKGRQRLTASKRPRKQSICAHDLSRGLRFSSQRSVSLIPSASGVNTVITPGLSSTTISVFKGSMNKFTDETIQYEKETRVTWHFNPNSPCIIPCFVYFRSIYFPLGRQKLAGVTLRFIILDGCRITYIRLSLCLSVAWNINHDNV